MGHDIDAKGINMSQKRIESSMAHTSDKLEHYLMVPASRNLYVSLGAPSKGPGALVHNRKGRYIAYAIYWALLKLDDLVWGVYFTIRTNTATYFS